MQREMVEITTENQIKKNVCQDCGRKLADDQEDNNLRNKIPLFNCDRFEWVDGRLSHNTLDAHK